MVDFDKGYEFLDTELERIVKDSSVGKKQADKLVKIFLRVCYWRFRCLFKFPVVKLLDYLEQWERLEESMNPLMAGNLIHFSDLLPKNQLVNWADDKFK